MQEGVRSSLSNPTFSYSGSNEQQKGNTTQEIFVYEQHDQKFSWKKFPQVTYSFHSVCLESLGKDETVQIARQISEFYLV